MSDSEKPEDRAAEQSGDSVGAPGAAEPVDAEFEPAPEDETGADGAAKPSSGGGGLKLVLFIILSAVIGGAAGFALSRYLPAEAVPGGELSGLEDRIAALEARDGGDLSGITERVSRIESVVQARDGLASRIDTLAATVEGLERRIAAGAPSEGEDEGAAPGAGSALADLEQRMGEAFTEVQDRFAALEGDIETVGAEAEAALSAAQQANTALSASGAGDGEAGAPADQRLAALSGRVGALEEALEEMGGVVTSLQDLPDRVDALAGQVSQAGEAADAGAGQETAASQQAVAQLRTRLGALSEQLEAVSGRVDALERGSGAQDAAQQAEPAGLAARALAFAALSEAATGSQPFAVELEALARVWPDAPGLDALRPVARDGAPTADRLQDRFPAEALREATGEQRTYFGVLRVARRQDEGSAAAIEQALADDDLAEAARLVGELDEAALAALGDWRDGLAARLGVRQALTRQSAALAAAGDRE